MNLFDQSFEFTPTPGKKLILSYGAGVDSTAIAVELVRRVRAGQIQYLPDAIVFADTGGEKPETYDYLQYFSNWLRGQGFPRITTVRAGGKYAVPEQGGLWKPEGLERKCLLLNTLPAVAFGWKTCSDNFKIQPICKWLRRRYHLIGAALRSAVCCIIGFEATEQARIKQGNEAPEMYERAYPLFRWGWDRARCKWEISKEGLVVPPKSACFFCPNSKEPEIQSLAVLQPALAARALNMERNATKAKTVKLGRSRAWEPILLAANAGLEAHLTEVSCGN